MTADALCRECTGFVYFDDGSWRHLDGGGGVWQRCPKCHWSGSRFGMFRVCPDCGYARLVIDHIADPDRGGTVAYAKVKEASR